MKLYCLAAASMMLLGAAVAEEVSLYILCIRCVIFFIDDEISNRRLIFNLHNHITCSYLLQYYKLNQPNLRGVAATFKEQVAKALGNPDDIKMYPHVGCSFDACCSYEDSEDSEDIKMYHRECTCEYDCDGEGGGEGRRGGGGGGGCAHCEDCCMYKGSDSFLTYCRGEGKRESCMNNGCCDGGEERGHGGHGGFHGHGFGHGREGGHGGEGGQCPDCGTTNLCCY